MNQYAPAVRPTQATAPVAAPAPMLALMDPVQFEQMQRVGKMLALSPLFPEHLRKGSEGEKIANGVLVMNMAVRLREDPLTVAQNIYFVGGRPGWNTTYMIAKANMHGVFKDPIDWEITGNGDTLSVTAYAIMSGTGKRVEMTADMEMAKAEGWTRNPKYKSIPGTMLRYRSAAALIRMYCPEIMIGIPIGIEVETADMRDVTPTHARDTVAELVEAETAQIEEAETVTEEVKAEPVKEDPAPRQQQKRNTSPAADHTDKTPHEDRPRRSQQKADDQSSMFEPSLSERIQITAEGIKDLIAEGTPLDEALEMFEVQLNGIKAEDADEYEAMIEEFQALAAKRDA